MTSQLRIGKVRSICTTLSVRANDGFEHRAGPITPEQTLLLLWNWSGFTKEEVSNDPRVAVLTVAPMIVDDKPYGAIRLGEEESDQGYTVLLEPADFALVAEQFQRTLDIIENEEDAGPSPGSSPPPPGEGRPTPRPPTPDAIPRRADHGQ